MNSVDPLEGTNFATKILGALSVIAVSNKNNLFNAPETYMNKISAKVNEPNVIDLDYSISKNIYNLSDYKNKKLENLTACVLDRPRHRKIIEELFKLKVNVKLISDGDVSGALLVTKEKYGVDIFLASVVDQRCVSSVTDAFNCHFQENSYLTMIKI